MRPKSMRILLTTVGVLASAIAHASASSDELEKCLVRAVTPDDQQVFIRWLFASAAAHPQMQDLFSADPETRTTAQKRMAAVTQRLLTGDCLAETRLAIKADGKAALETGFAAIGRMAGRAVFTDPTVSRASTEFLRYLDRDVFRDALGLPQ